MTPIRKGGGTGGSFQTEPKKLGASDVRIVRLVAVSEARLPLLQYWASDPLPLDVHTYRGEDVIGAEPLRAEPS
jgi:hypothetical protein